MVNLHEKYWANGALPGNCRQNPCETFSQREFLCLVGILWKDLGAGALAFVAWQS